MGVLRWFQYRLRVDHTVVVGQVLRLWVVDCRCFRQHLPDHVSVSTQYISLDSYPHCAQGDGVRCEAPLAVLSLALPDPSQRDRFPSLRRCYTRVTVAALSPEKARFVVSL